MIVAIYEKAFTLVLPVNPVNRIDRLTPQGNKQQRSKQNPSSFAAMLDAMLQAEDTEDAHEFDALAWNEDLWNKQYHRTGKPPDDNSKQIVSEGFSGFL